METAFPWLDALWRAQFSRIMWCPQPFSTNGFTSTQTARKHTFAFHLSVLHQLIFGFISELIWIALYSICLPEWLVHCMQQGDVVPLLRWWEDDLEETYTSGSFQYHHEKCRCNRGKPYRSCQILSVMRDVFFLGVRFWPKSKYPLWVAAEIEYFNGCRQKSSTQETTQTQRHVK